METTATERILRDLVAFDTTSRRSNLELIAYVQDYLGRHGVDSRLVMDATGQKANLWATIGPEGDGGVVLSGHTDCVPVDDQDWSSDPFTLTERDGRLYGRGACDMKGFLASVLAAVPDLVATTSPRPVHFAFSHDEEIGCVGGGACWPTSRRTVRSPPPASWANPPRCRSSPGTRAGSPTAVTSRGWLRIRAWLRRA